jgi:hypothetical protein
MASARWTSVGEFEGCDTGLLLDCERNLDFDSIRDWLVPSQVRNRQFRFARQGTPGRLTPGGIALDAYF